MKVKLSKYYKNKGRKIEVEIQNFDIWNLDESLAYIIYPALLKLKESKHGIPVEFAVVGGESWDNQQSFDFYTETVDSAYEEKIKQWYEILDKMIWAFGEIIRDKEENFHYGTIPNFKFKKTGQTMLNPLTNKIEELSELVDPDPNGHFFDMDGYVLYQDRIQEGLELFGKYYRSLWD